MTHDQAMKLSEVGIAVRYVGTRLVNYCSGAQPPAGMDPAVQGHEEMFIKMTNALVKVMPPDYAGIYTDWTPWKGKDAVTALGDLVRLANITRLVA